MTQIKQKVSSVLFRTGVISTFVRLENCLPVGSKNNFRILNYHRVNDFEDPFTIDSVAAKDFDAQMRYISKQYHILSMEDIYHTINQGGNLPPGCLAITFDDGYADNYTFAWPILKKYGLPATIFLTAGCIDTRTPLWFDQVLAGFKSSRKERFCSPFTRAVSDIQAPSQRLRTAHAILEQLKKAGQDNRQKIIPVVLSELGIENSTPPTPGSTGSPGPRSGR